MPELEAMHPINCAERAVNQIDLPAARTPPGQPPAALLRWPRGRLLPRGGRWPRPLTSGTRVGSTRPGPL
eukprot:2204456-Pyramimonas_sp.AAC.1